MAWSAKDQDSQRGLGDHALMTEIVDRRNGIAHRGEVVPRGNCWRYINEIEHQLQDWGVFNAS